MTPDLSIAHRTRVAGGWRLTCGEASSPLFSTAATGGLFPRQGRLSLGLLAALEARLLHTTSSPMTHCSLLAEELRDPPAPRPMHVPGIRGGLQVAAAGHFELPLLLHQLRDGILRSGQELPLLLHQLRVAGQTPPLGARPGAGISGAPPGPPG